MIAALGAAAPSPNRPAGWAVIVTACFVLLLVPYAIRRRLSKGLIWAMALIALAALTIGLLLAAGYNY